MTIQIDGTNCNNKGAELMLFAILQQIEKKCPKATVIINGDIRNYKLSDFSSSLSLKTTLGSNSFARKYNIIKYLKYLHLPYCWLTFLCPHQGVDVLFDASGFCYSDQWNLAEDRCKMMINYFDKMSKYGTKIFFLPQAWGPFEKEKTNSVVAKIVEVAEIIFAREHVSFEYFSQIKKSCPNLLISPDFTSLVNCSVPTKYKHLKDSVCIIPNVRMLDKTTTTSEEYMRFWKEIIVFCQKKGKRVFVLNHSDKSDRLVCNLLAHTYKLECVDYLDALEVKSVISQSYLVISSRYHGIASALNSLVPCLATGWSHKYELLFSDYSQHNNLLNVGDVQGALEKMNYYFNEENRNASISKMKAQKEEIQKATQSMWDKIWKKIEI